MEYSSQFGNESVSADEPAALPLMKRSSGGTGSAFNQALLVDVDPGWKGSYNSAVPSDAM